MWCQPRVPKASQVFGSRGCYPALGQIPGESFCLRVLSPRLAPDCRGIYFRGKKRACLALSAGMTRETNKGALKIIEVGEGGVLLPFQERKTNPRGFTSEQLPARGSKVRAGGEAESPGVSLRGCRGRAVPAGGAVPGPPFPGAQRHPAERPGRRHGGLPAARRGSRRPRSPPCRPAALRLPEPPPPRGQPARGFVKKPLPLHGFGYGFGSFSFFFFFWCFPPPL